VALLRIGQLARESGFTAKTLRYYEDVGLLRPAARGSNGYRLYAHESLPRLRLVRRAKGLGLPLADIRAILEITDDGRAPCEHVLTVVERALARIERQMQQLRSMRAELLGMRSRMTDAIAKGAATANGHCPCFEDPAGQSSQ